jgi:K(+)-stimulated pyrophosphate-energized sodium pump
MWFVAVIFNPGITQLQCEPYNKNACRKITFFGVLFNSLLLNFCIDIYKADVLSGLFIGAMIPFIFSSLAINAVGKAAMAMVEEVRRQFREIPGILEGTGQPEYDKCVAISTDASIKKMLLPGSIAIVTPLLVGFIWGPEVLGGFLAGAS